MSKKICIFGSSITRGSHDKEKLGWSERLKFGLSFEGSEYSVYNLAVSGHSTDELLKYLDIDCQTRPPHTVLIGIGINDCSYRESKKGKFIELDKFKDNLDKIKLIVEKYTKNIVFIGLTKVNEKKTSPIPWNTDAWYKNKDVLEYDLALKEFCEKNKFLFVEIFSLLEDDDLEDGLHPNSEGHKKMHQKIKQSLVENKIIANDKL